MTIRDIAYDPATRTVSGTAAMGATITVKLAGVFAGLATRNGAAWSYAFATPPAAGTLITVFKPLVSRQFVVPDPASALAAESGFRLLLEDDSLILLEA